jgi:hypothetical protein
MGKEIYDNLATLDARTHPLSARWELAIATMFELEKVDGKNAPRNVVSEALDRLIDSAKKGGMQLGEKPPYPLAMLGVLSGWPLI